MNIDEIDRLLNDAVAPLDARHRSIAAHNGFAFLRWARRLRLIMAVLMPLALILIFVTTTRIVPSQAGINANWVASRADVCHNIDQIFIAQ